jgi:L-Ala-D/L-Glu epimerase
MKLEHRRTTLRLRAPLRSAHGTLTERELLSVTITGADGVSGHGEAAPLPSYEGPGVARVERALERFRTALAPIADDEPSEILDACRAADELPEALAAIDLALWDRAGRIRGVPVAALLSDNPQASVAVNATLSALEEQRIAEQAAGAAAAGFRCLKIKVGVGDDAARVAAARDAAGADVALRLDANGAWSVEQAERALAALAPSGLELVEEPVHGLERVRALRARVDVRISIDETAREPGALGAAAADAVCLKISRCGGISGLLACAALVRTSGAEVYLASTLDGPLGVAAALHAAAALASRGPLPPCGLATLGLFANIDDPLPPSAGTIALPGAPGLGVEPL